MILKQPKSCYRMASKGIQPPWRWNGGTITTKLGVIWGMSAKIPGLSASTRSGAKASDEKGKNSDWREQ